MNRVKNIFKIIGFLVVILLVAAVAIPYFYHDRLVELVKEETNRSLNAKVDFEDVHISILRNFPALTLQLDDLQVVGVADFAGVPLFAAKTIELELDFWEVWSNRQSIPIEAFSLNEPVVNLQVLSNGKANWDITKPADPAAEPTTFLVQMDHYDIQNGQLVYNDQSLDFFMQMAGLDHQGTGNFTEQIFDLYTQTDVKSLTANMEGITYLKNAEARLDAILNVDYNNLVFLLKDNELVINRLALNAEGMVDMNDEEYVMDLTFQSPQNDFRDLWSIIPAAYTADYAQADIMGKMRLKGLLKGVYNAAKEQYPAFRIEAGIENGAVKYPDLPMALKGIFAEVDINSPGSDFDDMTVKIPQFEFLLGDNPFSGNFYLQNPISDPQLKTKVDGVLNLADFQQAIPMDDIQQLRGVVKSDFYINAAMSQVEKENYEAIDMQGDLELTDFFIQQTGMPDVTVHRLKTDFSPQRVQLVAFESQLGKSDLQATGSLENMLAYFSPEKTLKGIFKVESDLFDANEWMPATATEPAQKVGSVYQKEELPTALLVSNDNTGETEVFDRFDFDIDGKIGRLLYGDYDMRNFEVNGVINPKLTTIRNFSTKIGESDIKMRGTLENIMGYTFDNETLTGDIDFSSRYLDLNQFMTEAPADSVTAEEPLEVIPIPENMELNLTGQLGKVRYTNFTMEDVQGKVIVKERAAQLSGVNGKVLGGKLAFNGSYDTKDLSKPRFDIDTELESMNFASAFNTFNTFELLAPIGKFIDGKFNTTLKMNGILGQDMTPDLSTLNLSGFFHTLDGVVNGFKPLQELSAKLKIDKIKTIKIQDSKNWIEVQNGFVEVKEFEEKIDDMTFLISGKHGLNQEMNYKIKAKIPRALLEKTGITAAANEAWNQLSKLADSKGINLANGEFVNLKIDLTGSIQQPKFNIVPVAADGETSVKDATEEAIKNAVDEAVDSAKTVIDNTVEEVKSEAEAVKDTVSQVVKDKAEQVKEETKEATRSVIDSLKTGGEVKLPENLDSIGKDIIKDTTLQQELDKAKDKLKDLFGKKKKKGGGE